MTYKLAVIDLDGTLLGSDHTVSAVNADALRQAIGKGLSVVLASGRQHSNIAAFAHQIGLPESTPIVSYNGALIRTLSGETWFDEPLPAEAAARIVCEGQALGRHLNYYLDDLLYIREETPWSRMYAERTGTTPHVIGDLTQLDGRQPTKIVLIDDKVVTNELLPKFQTEFGDSLYITKTENEYLEFMQAGVNKGVALALVAERLQVSAADCVAFGDSYNDIPLLQWAGLAVAMGNARPELKAIADQIAPTNNENGVGRVLRELLG